MLFNSTLSGAGIPSYAEATTLELLSARGIYPATERTHSIKDHYLYHCPLPGHSNDTHPSFTLHADGIQWFCFPCGVGGGPAKLIQVLGSEPTARISKPPKPLRKPAKEVEEHLQGCRLAQLAEAKRLPIEHLRNLGWYDSEWKYKLDGHWTSCSAVAIPYRGGATRYRVGLTGKNRFRWQRDSSPELYGLDWLRSIDRTILLTEGESDTASGAFLGIATLGIPGVGTWKSHWAKDLADRDVVLWQEPGEPAQKLVDAIALDIPHIRVIQPPPGIKDIVELLDQAGSGAGDILRELIADAQPYYPERDVPNMEREYKSPFRIRDIRAKSQLWEAAKEYFPVNGKPWTVTKSLYNHGEGKGLVGEFPSNSWLNPANAQLKRQRLYFNVLPRINGPQLYWKLAPEDDQPQAHERIKKQVSRAMKKADETMGHGWVWFDNAYSRGHYLYLTSVPGVSGFEAFQGDVEPLLVDALKGIHPLEQGHEGRFRPYGGSDNWVSGVEGTGEVDRDKWQIVAVSNKPPDYVQVEAECVVSCIQYEYQQPYWRQQIGPGLEIKLPFEEFVQLCVDLGQQPTRAGRAAFQDDLEILRV